ncbi:AI-2E family transporter [Oscillochloris sp. ZM17-4]|uniref:AI-2E family transporter n=1 Tax=Oscillochloris sp. ZM17-4 TaxID=2866714 RepID=UPI001C7394C3|nr:AI-2E family transporter [Oscillochloris sp. ZM17-4]MBX0328100.1 AI-2E family transporter [Oscillochloris sp. ZM17-4]
MSQESVPIRFSARYKLITTAVIVALTILFFQHIRHVLPPFIGAIITAYLFNPLVTWLQRRTGMGRAIWIVVLYVLAFLLFYGLFIWIWPIIVEQTRDMARAAPQLVNEIRSFFEGREQIELGGFVIDLAPLEDQLISVVRDMGAWMSGNVPRLVFSALETVIYILVYLIITFYLLLEAGQLKTWSSNLIPAPYRDEIGSLGRQIDAVFSAYIRGQLLLIVIMSVLLYIPLSILQVPYALVIAVASGTLEILPIIGPWSAAGIAITATLFQTEIPFGLSGLGLAAMVGAIYFLLRQIEDHFIIPNIMGPLVRLHPAMVIFAILAGGALGGAFGLFISIPLAAVVRILLSYLYRKMTDQPEPPASPPTTTREQEEPAKPASQPKSTEALNH